MIFDLFLRVAEDPDWRWLLAILPKVSTESAEVPAVQPLVHVVSGYILAHLGEESTARAELELAGKTIRVSAKKYRVNPREWAIIGLGWAKLTEYDKARTYMAFAIRERFSKTHMYCPPNEAAYTEGYRDTIPPNRRLVDLLWIFNACRNTMQSIMFFPGQHESSNLAFIQVWYDALATIPQPIEWAKGRLSAERSGSTRWTVTMLFVALARTERIEETLGVWKLLKENGLTIPSDAATRLSAALLKSGSRDLASEVYLIENNSHAGLSRLLAAFAMVDMMDEAMRSLREIIARFKPTWADVEVVARASARKGNVRQTHAVLTEVYGPSLKPKAIELLIQAHCNANDPTRAEALLDRVFTVNGVNLILRLYADRGELDPAINIFDRLLDAGTRPNLKTYTALITLFAKRLDMESVERLLTVMRTNGLEPDSVVWASVLDVHVAMGEYVAAANRWQSLPLEIQSNPAVSAAILRAFVHIAAPTELVISLFRQFQRPDTYQWALVIQSACDNGNLELAKELFEEMDERADPRPDIVTLSILLHGHLRVKDGMSARAIYDEMAKRNLLPTSITYSQIIQSIAAPDSQQSLDQAQQFAMSIQEQAKKGGLPEIGSERSRTTERLVQPLVVASGRRGQPEISKAYFDMATRDQAPTMSMWTALLDSYRRAGDVEKVMQTWESIFKDACSTPNAAGESIRSQGNILCIPLSIVLDALSTAGRHTELRDVWKNVREAGFGFDSGNYNHFAVALARTGDVESAFHVIDTVVLPRWDEVRQRRNAALRSGRALIPLESWETFDNSGQPDVEPVEIDDKPVDTASDRNREKFRFDSPFGYRGREHPESVAQQLLESWRPNDILWRPSLLTIAVLDQAYEEVERARQRARNAWLLLAADEEKPEESEENIRLESFGGVPIRDPDGQPTKSKASALIARLNRKYARTVGLIMLHRRKRRSREYKERAGIRDY